MTASLSISEWKRRPGGPPPRSGRYGAGGAAGAALPCFVSRLACRHSARVFSSPALHACFAARPAARLSRRSSRRSIPCVWAYTGTAPASATTAAKTPTPLRRLMVGRMLFSFGAAIVSVGRPSSKKKTRGAVPIHRAMREYPPFLREKRGLRSKNYEAQIPHDLATPAYRSVFTPEFSRTATSPSARGVPCPGAYGRRPQSESTRSRPRRETGHAQRAARSGVAS